MLYPVPTFKEAKILAEKKLTGNLGEKCHIVTRKSLSKESIASIRNIESNAFRAELRNNREEMIARGNKKDFFLLILHHDRNPIGILYGYQDPMKESGFFLDTVATTIEGKGIGSTLIALAMLHALETGYQLIILRTEEEDEKGRKLRHFYENLGFQVFSYDPLAKSIVMQIELNLDRILPTIYKALNYSDKRQ